MLSAFRRPGPPPPSAESSAATEAYNSPSACRDYLCRDRPFSGSLRGRCPLAISQLISVVFFVRYEMRVVGPKPRRDRPPARGSGDHGFGLLEDRDGPRR